LSDIDIQEGNSSVTFAVRVIPRASKSEIVGELDGALKVKLKAPPVDGAANDELVNLIAERIGVRPGSINIVAGRSSRNKRIQIIGVNRTQLQKALAK